MPVKPALLDEAIILEALDPDTFVDMDELRLSLFQMQMTIFDRQVPREMYYDITKQIANATHLLSLLGFIYPLAAVYRNHELPSKALEGGLVRICGMLKALRYTLTAKLEEIQELPLTTYKLN